MHKNLILKYEKIAKIYTDLYTFRYEQHYVRTIGNVYLSVVKLLWKAFKEYKFCLCSLDVVAQVEQVPTVFSTVVIPSVS